MVVYFFKLFLFPLKPNNLNSPFIRLLNSFYKQRFCSDSLCSTVHKNHRKNTQLFDDWKKTNNKEIILARLSLNKNSITQLFPHRHRKQMANLLRKPIIWQCSDGCVHKTLRWFKNNTQRTKERKRKKIKLKILLLKRMSTNFIFSFQKIPILFEQQFNKSNELNHNNIYIVLKM